MTEIPYVGNTNLQAGASICRTMLNDDDWKVFAYSKDT